MPIKVINIEVAACDEIKEELQNDCTCPLHPVKRAPRNSKLKQTQRLGVIVPRVSKLSLTIYIF